MPTILQKKSKEYNNNSPYFLIQLPTNYPYRDQTTPSSVRAQAPSDDPNRRNDDMVAASSIPSMVELPTMTIYPAGDPDFYRAMMPSGDYQAQVIATLGLDLTLQIYGPANSLIITNNDASSPPKARVRTTILDTLPIPPVLLQENGPEPGDSTCG